MIVWIDIPRYKEFKVGDSVKRSDGGQDVSGKPWDTEGVIVRIVYWHKDKSSVWLHVAEKGDLKTIVILAPDRAEKINKEFKLHENGKMSLF